MSIITCLKELNEKGCLEYKDEVIFTVNEETIEYTVTNCYLHNYPNHNYRIFRILELDKSKLAEKIYGYRIKTGYWPPSKTGDYPALTRLVKELYKTIEEKEIKYTKYNRFEIMDI